MPRLELAPAKLKPHTVSPPASLPSKQRGVASASPEQFTVRIAGWVNSERPFRHVIPALQTCKLTMARAKTQLQPGFGSTGRGIGRFAEQAIDSAQQRQ